MAHCSLAVDATDKCGQAIYIQTAGGRVTGWVETKLWNGVGPDRIAVHDRSHFNGDEERERVVVGPFSLSLVYFPRQCGAHSVDLSFLCRDTRANLFPEFRAPNVEHSRRYWVRRDPSLSSRSLNASDPLLAELLQVLQL